MLHRLLLGGLVLPFARAVARPLTLTWHADPAALRGPLVIVANHASHLDTPVILAALPPHLRHRAAPAAAEDYFFRNPFLGAGLTALAGAFPFPRSGSDGIERAADLLADGWSVLLFPEGTRSSDGRPGRFHSGVGHLLSRTGVPALPIGLAGTFGCWPRGHTVPQPGPVAIRVGVPWLPPAGTRPCAITRALERQVIDLLPPPLEHVPRALSPVLEVEPLAA